MKLRIYIVAFILLFQFSCKKDDTLTSFTLNNKKMEDSNENLNIKNESFLEAIYIQAEKNDELIDRKETAKKVHAIGEDLYKYIEDLKSVIKEKNSTEFVNELFFNGDSNSKEGEEFLMYIKNYSNSMHTTLSYSNPRIVGMVNNNFDLSVIEDRRGQKTNWLNLNFRDFSPIISITKLSTMQSDIRRIETQYLAELLGVTLNASTRRTMDSIKKVTSKQISENSTQNQDSTIDNINKDLELVKANEDNKEKEIISEAKKEIVKEPIEKAEKIIIETPKKEIVIEKKKITKIVPVVKAKRTHVVKPGENLYRISLKYKMTAKKIKKLNGMRNNNIVVGQTLKLE